MTYVSIENNMELGKRLQFGDAILRLSQTECAHYDLRQAVGSRWFKNFIIQHQFRMEDFSIFESIRGSVCCSRRIFRGRLHRSGIQRLPS